MDPRDPLDDLDPGLRREVAAAGLAMAEAECGRRREVRSWALRAAVYTVEIAQVRPARQVWETLHDAAAAAGAAGDVEVAEIYAALAQGLEAVQYATHGIDRLAGLGLRLSDVEPPPMR